MLRHRQSAGREELKGEKARSRHCRQRCIPSSPQGAGVGEQLLAHAKELPEDENDLP